MGRKNNRLEDGNTKRLSRSSFRGKNRNRSNSGAQTHHPGQRIVINDPVEIKKYADKVNLPPEYRRMIRLEQHVDSVTGVVTYNLYFNKAEPGRSVLGPGHGHVGFRRNGKVYYVRDVDQPRTFINFESSRK